MAHRITLFAGTAAFGLLVLNGLGATKEQRAPATGPTLGAATVPGEASCGQVSQTYSDGEEGALVEIWAAGLTCDKARQIVKACIQRARLPSWGQAIDARGELILQSGPMSIRIIGLAGGGPRCVAD